MAFDFWKKDKNKFLEEEKIYCPFWKSRRRFDFLGFFEMEVTSSSRFCSEKAKCCFTKEEEETERFSFDLFEQNDVFFRKGSQTSV